MLRNLFTQISICFVLTTISEYSYSQSKEIGIIFVSGITKPIIKEKPNTIPSPKLNLGLGVSFNKKINEKLTLHGNLIFIQNSFNLIENISFGIEDISYLEIRTKYTSINSPILLGYTILNKDSKNYFEIISGPVISFNLFKKNELILLTNEKNMNEFEIELNNSKNKNLSILGMLGISFNFFDKKNTKHRIMAGYENTIFTNNFLKYDIIIGSQNRFSNNIKSQFSFFKIEYSIFLKPKTR